MPLKGIIGLLLILGGGLAVLGLAGSVIWIWRELPFPLAAGLVGLILIGVAVMLLVLLVLAEAR